MEDLSSIFNTNAENCSEFLQFTRESFSRLFDEKRKKFPHQLTDEFPRSRESERENRDPDNLAGEETRRKKKDFPSSWHEKVKMIFQCREAHEVRENSCDVDDLPLTSADLRA